MDSNLTRVKTIYAKLVCKHTGKNLRIDALLASSYFWDSPGINTIFYPKDPTPQIGPSVNDFAFYSST